MRVGKILKKICICALIIALAMSFGNNKKMASDNNYDSLAQTIKTASNKKEYGVFIGATGSLKNYKNYKTIIIDAQYFSAKKIKKFKKAGCKVYSYINVGALENFRDYYDDYKNLTLGQYENWDEEVFIDVSSKKWQKFIIDKLAPSLMKKGVDGLFVDNADVYYEYKQKKIYKGLKVILKKLKLEAHNVIINGGDVFVSKYMKNGGNLNDIATGINQESVFTKINWENESFAAADKDSRKYFKRYLKKCAAKGADIYIIEYTKNSKLKKKIKKYCMKRDYKVYISGSLELT